MISHKLSNMRYHLNAMGLSYRDADRYVDLATKDINQKVSDLVSGAVEEAVSFGQIKNADEFMAQIKLDSNNGYIQISTDSGSLDFSTPATPMLPWLLKGAKTAKDGSQYKVIPVGANSNPRSPKPVKNIAQGLDAMRMADYSKSTDMATQMVAAFGGGSSQTMIKPQETKSNGEIHFRVASSKQDASSKWVLPAKDGNLSSDIAEINSRLRGQIDIICDEVIEYYSQEAQDYVRNA